MKGKIEFSLSLYIFTIICNCKPKPIMDKMLYGDWLVDSMLFNGRTYQPKDLDTNKLLLQEKVLLNFNNDGSGYCANCFYYYTNFSINKNNKIHISLQNDGNFAIKPYCVWQPLVAGNLNNANSYCIKGASLTIYCGKNKVYLEKK